MYSWKTVLVTIGLLVGLKIWKPYFIENISWSWFDFLHQQEEKVHVDDIVLVDIDEKALEKYGQFFMDERYLQRDSTFLKSITYACLLNLATGPDRFRLRWDLFAEGLINRLTILSSQIN